MRTPTDTDWLDALCERQRLDLVGDLAGGLAHELNNALSVVSGYQDLLVESLEDGGETADEMRNKAQTIHTWTGTALAVARRLYDVSRQMREDEGPASAAAVINESVELCRYRCERERILLVAELCAPDVRVAAAPRVLLQIVVNLVQNAREAIVREGSAGDDEEGGTIRVAAEVDAGRLRVVVEDDGPGITAADAESIFALGATAKEGEKFGFGLPVSRRLAERCGGSLRADAGDLGRFVVELPLSASA